MTGKRQGEPGDLQGQGSWEDTQPGRRGQGPESGPAMGNLAARRAEFWLPTHPPDPHGTRLGPRDQDRLHLEAFPSSRPLIVWSHRLPWSPIGRQPEVLISSCVPWADSSLRHFPGSPHVSSSLATHSLSQNPASSKTNRERHRGHSWLWGLAAERWEKPSGLPRLPEPRSSPRWQHL